MWILTIGNKPLEWIKPDISGMPPEPRYLHTMNFFEEGNFLIIHGGRHNKINEEDFAFKDFHILELNKLEWLRVEINCWYGKINLYNRCGHSSILDGKFFLKTI